MLRCGVGNAVISPPLGVALAGYMVSEGREDPATAVAEDLRAYALVLDDEQCAVCLLALDVIGVPEAVRLAIEKAAQGLGLDADAVQIAATHTHSGPELDAPVDGVDPERAAAWDPVVVERVIAGARVAIEQALADVVVAQPRVGEAQCSINVNRRERGPDGRMKGLPWLGRNPDGPVDHAVRTLRLQRSDRPDVVLVVYACHPVVLGVATVISPDLFGAARRHASRALDDAVVMVVQGPSGDVNPLIHPGRAEDCERLGAELGAAIVEAAHGDLALSVHDLAHRRATCRLPVKRTFPDVDGDPMMDDWVHMYREGSQGRHDLEATLTAIRIGPLGIVGLPVELFTVLGDGVRARSPLQQTFVMTLTGGKLGYLPDAGAYPDGGYEVVTTPFEAGADAVLVDAAVALLQTVAAPDQAHRPV